MASKRDWFYILAETAFSASAESLRTVPHRRELKEQLATLEKLETVKTILSREQPKPLNRVCAVSEAFLFNANIFLHTEGEVTEHELCGSLELLFLNLGAA